MKMMSDILQIALSPEYYWKDRAMCWCVVILAGCFILTLSIAVIVVGLN